MHAFHLLTRGERCAGIVMGVVVGTSVLVALLLPFADAGRTPWFNQESQVVQTLQRCNAQRSSSGRHRCVREVAAAASANLDPARLAVAKR